MSDLGEYLAELIRSNISTSARASRLARVFDELPLPLSEWIASPDHMNLQGPPDPETGEPRPYLSPVQFGVLRHVEQVYPPDLYEDLAREVSLRWRPVRFVNTLWMMVGKGGGKDMVAALAQLRIAYLMMCLREPQRFMGIGRTSRIHMLNTASSEGQAENIYFAELRGLLEHAPWFKGKYDGVSREINYEKRITAVSGNSKEEAQEGMNLLLGVLDEIDAFRTKEEREKTARTARGAMLNADGIFEMMKTSGSSRFPQSYKVLGLSWPRYVGSFIWTKYHEGLADNELFGRQSRIYVVKATTWESNPTKRPEDFEHEYRENPELCRAKYECRPPESEDPYFKNRIAVRQNFIRNFPNNVPPLTTSYVWGLPDETDLELNALGEFRRMRGVAPKEGWQLQMEWADWFVCKDSFPRAIHVDTGLRNDRTGLAMAHVRGWSTEMVPHYNEIKGEWEEVEQRRPLVTVDLVLALAAPKPAGGNPGGEVELRWIRRIIFELVGRGFPVARVSYDGYQSADSMQLLQHAGIETEYFSLDRNMEGYDTAKSVLYSGGMQAHRHELLEKELLALTIVNGRKVDHPPGGSKDVADAWAGAVHGAIVLAESAGAVSDLWMPDMVPMEDVRRGMAPPQQPGGMLAGIPDDLIQLGGGVFKGYEG